MKNQEVEKELLMDLYCLMQVKECLAKAQDRHVPMHGEDPFVGLKRISEQKAILKEKITQKKSLIDHWIKTGGISNHP